MLPAENKNLIASLWIIVGEYVVYWGWPLWVRWIREADDVDVCVSRSVRLRLLQSGKHNVIATKYGNESFIVWNMEVAYTIPWLSFNEIEDAIKNADIIDGVAYLSLSYTKQSKKYMNREKDRIDIALIDAYLAEWN